MASLFIAAACALALAGSAGAQEQITGAIAVDCEGNTLAVDASCQFGATQEFSVSVHVTRVSGEYAGVQLQLRWDPAVVDYLPTDRPSQETAKDDCTLPVRRVFAPEDPSVMFGCISFSGSEDEPILLSTYTGPVAVFRMRCQAEGTAALTLDEFDLSNEFGTDLLNEIGRPQVAELSPATVTCGGADVVRPQPEVTVGVDSIADTPVPGDGRSTPADGETGTTAPDDGDGATPTPGGSGEAPGDDDEADGGFPVWGWIVIAVVVVGGLGAAGAGWLRLRRSSGSS